LTALAAASHRSRRTCICAVWVRWLTGSNCRQQPPSVAQRHRPTTISTTESVDLNNTSPADRAIAALTELAADSMATPITTLTEAQFPDWLAQQPERVRSWATAQGFSAAPFSILCVPSDSGGLVGVL